MSNYFKLLFGQNTNGMLQTYILKNTANYANKYVCKS